MFEYQAETIIRNRYNFEAPVFSVDSLCFDYPDVDEDGNWNVGDDVLIPISPDMTSIQVWETIAAHLW